MPPRKGTKKRKTAGRYKSTAKKPCLGEDYQTVADPEKELKLLPEYLALKTSIIPQLQEIDKFIDIHLWKQEHKYDSTFSGRLEQMQNEMKVLQKTDKDIKKFLRTMLKLSQKEALSIRKALQAINIIRTKRFLMLSGSETGRHLRFSDYIRDIGRSAPVWMGLTNEIAPPLCGAISPPDNHEFKVGHLVAAHVVSEAHEEVHAELGIIGEWILSIIVRVNNLLYTVKDMDGSGTTYNVPRRKLIALPLYIADPETNPEAIYPEDSLVLALYTNTTCFFPGIVTSSPKCKKEDYKIRFRDISEHAEWGGEIAVEQQFVIPYRDVYSTVTDEEKKYLISTFGKSSIMPIRERTS